MPDRKSIPDDMQGSIDCSSHMAMPAIRQGQHRMIDGACEQKKKMVY